MKWSAALALAWMLFMAVCGVADMLGLLPYPTTRVARIKKLEAEARRAGARPHEGTYQWLR